MKKYKEKNLTKLIETIISCGDAEWLFAFAAKVNGLTDIERLKLMKTSIELAEKYGESSAVFAKRIRFKPNNKKSGK